MDDNKNKATVNVTIENSTVQVVPNADSAIQNINFYGDQYVPQELLSPMPTAVSQRDQSESPDDEKRAMAISSLKIHIANKERLNDYLKNLSICESAAQMAEVIVTMRRNEGWPDDVEIKKERFIEMMKILAPRVTKGNTVSNIRARIKEKL